MSSIPTLSKSLEWLARSFATVAESGKPISFDGPVAATFAIVVDLAITRLEEFDQLVASDVALRQERRAREAEIRSLSDRLRLFETGAMTAADLSPEPSPHEGAEVIDLGEAMRREGRTNRPNGGGDAA